jgi:hypothetical protein
MLKQDRFEEIIQLLQAAYDAACDEDFRNLWHLKIEEVQRSELLEINLHQQEGKLCGHI